MPQINLELEPQPLTAADFRPFGDVIEVSDDQLPILINDGLCQRFHDLATLSFDRSDMIGISLFRSQSCGFPLRLTHMERHPLASQTFIPMSSEPYLVIVSGDDGGKPGTPRVFISNGQQAVNYHRNTWHATLTTLADDSLFAVVDYVGDKANLQVARLEHACLINVR